MGRRIKAMQTRKIKAEDVSDVTYGLHEYGINPHSRELFLHSYIMTEHGTGESGIDAELGVDYRMAATFIKNLSLLNQQGKDNILVHQVCCGGDWDYGMAIYDAILCSEAPVIILAYAHARSMSSIILQAAKLRILMPDCCFLVHHGWAGIEDRTKAVISNAEFWKTVEMPRMLDVYATRCTGKLGVMTKKKRTEYITDRLDKKTDWILTAADAVAHGFADGILGMKNYKTIKSIRDKV